MSWPAWLCVLVLLIMAGEAGVLVRRHGRSGRGPAPADVLPTLASGAALVVALLLAVLAAPPIALLPCLAASLLAHLLDLRRRLRD